MLEAVLEWQGQVHLVKVQALYLSIYINSIPSYKGIEQGEPNLQPQVE